MNHLEQFINGMDLLPSADEYDRKTIESRVKQAYYSASNQEQEAILRYVTLFMLMGKGHPNTSLREIHFLLRLLCEAMNGDLAWESWKEITRYDIAFYAQLLKDYPSKFGPATLAEMQRKVDDLTEPTPIRERLPRKYHTREDEGEIENAKTLSKAIYQLRLKSYLTETGPTLGASFEKEYSILEEALANANSPPIVAEALENAHKKLMAPQDQFSFKDSMDITRSAFEQILTQLANGNAVQPGVTGGATLRAFFDKEMLSDHEYQLGKSLYRFLSEKGVHALTSERNEARVSLFMVMEYSLYLLVQFSHF
jgi:hypothetical protein